MILSGILHTSLGGFTVIRGVAPLGELALISNTTTASGVAINIFRPNGVLRVGSFDA